MDIKLNNFWWTINAVLFLVSLGIFHAATIFITIMCLFQPELSIISKIIMFITTLPINLFTVLTIREEVIKSRKYTNEKNTVSRSNGQEDRT